MFKEHRMFHTPDLNGDVWRYLDFTKFVDLITSRKLFFCRSDNFEDPFEGIFRLKDYESTKFLFDTQEATKKYYFLNCWHLNNNQSDAMWKIFLSTNNGIAIKSTVGNIIKSLENAKDDVYISKVYYRDFDKVTFAELTNESQNSVFEGRGTSISQFNYKRISFEHEKELRLIYIDTPIPHTTKNGVQREPITKKSVQVELNQLINEIIIAPFADEWFLEMLKRLINQLGLNFKISQSNLYKK